MDKKENAIICDIDGCLIQTDWIFNDAKRLGLNGEETFTLFDLYANDIMNSVDKNLVLTIKLLNFDKKIIFLTARSEDIRERTRKNLERILPGVSFLLCMRPSDDKRPQKAVKEDYLRTITEHYNVVLAIDDSAENCAVFEKHDIPYIQWKFGEQNEINRPH